MGIGLPQGERAFSRLRAGVPSAVLGTVPGSSGLSLRGLCPASLTFVLLPDPRSYLALDSEPRAAVGSKFKW